FLQVLVLTLAELLSFAQCVIAGASEHAVLVSRGRNRRADDGADGDRERTQHERLLVDHRVDAILNLTRAFLCAIASRVPGVGVSAARSMRAFLVMSAFRAELTRLALLFGAGVEALARGLRRGLDAFASALRACLQLLSDARAREARTQ